MWFKQQRSKAMPLSDVNLQQKVILISRQLSETDQFTARSGIRLLTVSQEKLRN